MWEFIPRATVRASGGPEAGLGRVRVTPQSIGRWLWAAQCESGDENRRGGWGGVTSAAVLTSMVAAERWREVGAAGLNPRWVGPGILSHSPQMQ